MKKLAVLATAIALTSSAVMAQTTPTPPGGTNPAPVVAGGVPSLALIAIPLVLIAALGGGSSSSSSSSAATTTN